jgi:hypothetical protein
VQTSSGLAGKGGWGRVLLGWSACETRLVLYLDVYLRVDLSRGIDQRVLLCRSRFTAIPYSFGTMKDAPMSLSCMSVEEDAIVNEGLLAHVCAVYCRNRSSMSKLLTADSRNTRILVTLNISNQASLRVFFWVGNLSENPIRRTLRVSIPLRELQYHAIRKTTMP